jgi:hypothetical protein
MAEPMQHQEAGIIWETQGVCRGAESNCLRRPFQGRALPVSYLGTGQATIVEKSYWTSKGKTAEKEPDDYVEDCF